MAHKSDFRFLRVASRRIYGVSFSGLLVVLHTAFLVFWDRKLWLHMYMPDGDLTIIGRYAASAKLKPAPEVVARRPRPNMRERIV